MNLKKRKNICMRSCGERKDTRKMRVIACVMYCNLCVSIRTVVLGERCASAHHLLWSQSLALLRTVGIEKSEIFQSPVPRHIHEHLRDKKGYQSDGD